ISMRFLTGLSAIGGEELQWRRDFSTFAMTSARSAEISALLRAWGGGDPVALDRLTSLVYDELRRVAHRYMRKERAGNTLQTTALVNEAYLRLADMNRVDWQDRAHFLAVSAQVMRR